MPSFALAVPAAGALALPTPAEPPQGVYGVFQNYNFQAYAGYTYLRFYEVPNVTPNMNGFNMSIVYFPKAGHFALDGEFVAVFGSQPGATAKFAMGMGGGRYRWSANRGLEIWIHGLVGGAHFLPQTPYGGQNAIGWEAGGGIDLAPHHRRLGVRLEADAVGTYFFSTYQYSPKISAGLFYKF